MTGPIDSCFCQKKFIRLKIRTIITKQELGIIKRKGKHTLENRERGTLTALCFLFTLDFNVFCLHFAFEQNTGKLQISVTAPPSFLSDSKWGFLDIQCELDFVNLSQSLSSSFFSFSSSFSFPSYSLFSFSSSLSFPSSSFFSFSFPSSFFFSFSSSCSVDPQLAPD